MSKDAQLLRAMGMGPEERPELWAVLCDFCESEALIDGFDLCIAQAFCNQRNHESKNKHYYPLMPLGLDCDPSEWTVEHDANFARVVWPWLRGLSEVKQGPIANRLAIAISPQYSDPWDKHTTISTVFGWLFSMHPNPGPTMCQAIYNVLCGEGE